MDDTNDSLFKQLGGFLNEFGSEALISAIVILLKLIFNLDTSLLIVLATLVFFDRQFARWERVRCNESKGSRCLNFKERM